MPEITTLCFGKKIENEKIKQIYVLRCICYVYALFSWKIKVEAYLADK